MRRFSLPPDWKPGEGCVLEGGRARYLSRVLRLAPGDRFPGLDAEGRSWLCELLEAGPDRLVIGVGPLPPGCAEPERLEDIRGGRAAGPASAAAGSARLGPPEAARPPITLVQGLPKGSKMDLVVRQAAEAGVARVLPLRALRSLPEADSAARLERWRRIAREALQQSGSAVPTRVEAPIGLEALPGALGEGGPGRLRLFLDEEAPLAQSSLHGYLTEAPGEVVLCVGPEGGFAAEERRFLAGSGFVPFRLPCAVLRTETAALFAVAAVEIVLSERSSWIPSTS